MLGLSIGKIVVQHIDGHGQLQGAEEMLDHGLICGHLGSGCDVHCSQRGEVLRASRSSWAMFKPTKSLVVVSSHKTAKSRSVKI